MGVTRVATPNAQMARKTLACMATFRKSDSRSREDAAIKSHKGSLPARQEEARIHSRPSQSPHPMPPRLGNPQTRYPATIVPK